MCGRSAFRVRSKYIGSPDLTLLERKKILAYDKASNIYLFILFNLVNALLHG